MRRLTRRSACSANRRRPDFRRHRHHRDGVCGSDACGHRHHLKAADLSVPMMLRLMWLRLMWLRRMRLLLIWLRGIRRRAIYLCLMCPPRSAPPRAAEPHSFPQFVRRRCHRDDAGDDVRAVAAARRPAAAVVAVAGGADRVVAAASDRGHAEVVPVVASGAGRAAAAADGRGHRAPRAATALFRSAIPSRASSAA